MEIIDMIKKDLDVNYHDKEDDVIKEMYKHYLQIASNTSNRNINDKLLIPYVYTAVKSAYLRRGNEGSTSNNEGGLSSSYIDIEDKLKKDVLAIRKGDF